MVTPTYMLFGSVLIKDPKVWFLSDTEICLSLICITVSGSFIATHVSPAEEKTHGLCQKVGVG